MKLYWYGLRLCQDMYLSPIQVYFKVIPRSNLHNFPRLVLFIQELNIGHYYVPIYRSISSYHVRIKGYWYTAIKGGSELSKVMLEKSHYINFFISSTKMLLIYPYLCYNYALFMTPTTVLTHDFWPSWCIPWWYKLCLIIVVWYGQMCIINSLQSTVQLISQHG